MFRFAIAVFYQHITEYKKPTTHHRNARRHEREELPNHLPAETFDPNLADFSNNALTTPPWFPTVQDVCWNLLKAFSSSPKKLHQARFRFMFSYLSSREIGEGHVLSRLGHRATGPELDLHVQQQLFSVSLVGKESILKRSLNGIQGEKGAQHKLYHWGDELGKMKSRTFQRDRSGLWISAISVESSEPMGRSGKIREIFWRYWIRMQLWSDLRSWSNFYDCKFENLTPGPILDCHENT